MRLVEKLLIKQQANCSDKHVIALLSVNMVRYSCLKKHKNIFCYREVYILNKNNSFFFILFNIHLKVENHRHCVTTVSQINNTIIFYCIVLIYIIYCA